MIEKILLADSGTGQAEQMLRALMELPVIKPATVTVLHVVPPQVSADEMQLKREEGAKTLARAVESLHLDPQQVTSVNTLLREGDPKDTVCRVAEDIDTDLIIMGSRGLKRLVSILDNSVSQYVFQLSPRPMLLVKDDIFVRKLSRIMVALNNSASSRACLKLALDLLQDLKGGKLILSHVNPERKGRIETTGAEAEKDPILAPAVAEAKRRGISYQCFTGVGKPGEEICLLAKETNTDLLILGSPDRRPSIARNLPDLDRLLGTSLSDYVRVYANCPVLFTRQQEL
jgi:nucleotide-binding universal stress UspA family protein